MLRLMPGGCASETFRDRFTPNPFTLAGAPLDMRRNGLSEEVDVLLEDPPLTAVMRASILRSG